MQTTSSVTDTNTPVIVVSQPSHTTAHVTDPRAEHRKRLRAAIARRVERSVELRCRAREVSGDERHNLHMEARRNGLATRHMLLALVYLRGKHPYSRVEPRTHNKVVSSYEITLLTLGIDASSAVDVEVFRRAHMDVTVWLKT